MPLDRKAYNREYYQKNKERLDAYNREYNKRNLDAMREARRKYYKANKARLDERTNDWHYRKRYGITLAQYRAMYDAQEGKCAVCHRFKKVLCVDHNHVTGKVRELLCQQCNMFVFYIEEGGIDVYKYLDKHKEISNAS